MLNLYFETQLYILTLVSYRIFNSSINRQRYTSTYVPNKYDLKIKNIIIKDPSAILSKAACFKVSTTPVTYCTKISSCQMGKNHHLFTQVEHFLGPASKSGNVALKCFNTSLSFGCLIISSSFDLLMLCHLTSLAICLELQNLFNLLVIGK